MVNIGVVGCGYWGPNLIRNFAESPESCVSKVCDLNQERLKSISVKYPSVGTTSCYSELLQDATIDAIVIATPVGTHFDLALKALQANKHVFVEKPLCKSSDECEILIQEAEKRKLTLMVDHTFVYTGAVRKIKELISSGELGDLIYYDAQRVNLGLIQPDVDVIWDLAVHDLAILDFIIDQTPVAVSATGLRHIDGALENVAYMTLSFSESLIGHINVNWLAPTKIRQLLIGGSKKMIVFDDLEPSEKVKVYDKGVDVTPSSEDLYKLMVSYRTGDMWAPKIDTVEALKIEAEHFVKSIEAGTPPITDGKVGLRVVKILEAASKSMALGGTPVDLI